MTAAPKELRDEVIATMTAAGVTCVEKTGDSVICTAPVAKVNALLKTSLTAYKHKETGALFHMADGSHTFPESLVGACALLLPWGFAELHPSAALCHHACPSLTIFP